MPAFHDENGSKVCPEATLSTTFRNEEVIVVNGLATFSKAMTGARESQILPVPKLVLMNEQAE